MSTHWDSDSEAVFQLGDRFGERVRKNRGLIPHDQPLRPAGLDFGSILAKIKPTGPFLPALPVRKYCAVYNLRFDPLPWHGRGRRLDPDQNLKLFVLHETLLAGPDLQRSVGHQSAFALHLAHEVQSPRLQTQRRQLSPYVSLAVQVDQASSETLPSAWPTHVRTKPSDLDSGSSPFSAVIRTCPFSNRVLQVPHWPCRHADGI